MSRRSYPGWLYRWGVGRSRVVHRYRVHQPAWKKRLEDKAANRLYVSLENQLPLTTDKKNGYDPRYCSSFTLTPRYEGGGFGIYLPVSHNALTDLIIGTSLRMGPFFIGSGSALTALLGNSRQADVHVGLRFGGLQKDQLKQQARDEKKDAKKEQKRKEKEAEKAAAEAKA